MLSRKLICEWDEDYLSSLKIFQVKKRHWIRLTFCDAGFLEHVLQRVMDFLERGSVVWVPTPAGAHQLVDLGRTARRTLHSVVLL